jgi:flagellar motor switch protein FliM
MATEKQEKSTRESERSASLLKDQLNTMERLHAAMAREMASGFSAIQRSVIDLDLIRIDQISYADFLASLSDPCCGYRFTVNPQGKRAALVFDHPIAYSFIDRAFGGDGRNPPQGARPITLIERDVMEEPIGAIFTSLSLAWKPLAELLVEEIVCVDAPGDVGVGGRSDRVVVVLFEYTSQHASGVIKLCYPCDLVEAFQAGLTSEAGSVPAGPDLTDEDEALLDSEIPAPPAISSAHTLKQIAARYPQDMAGLFQ